MILCTSPLSVMLFFQACRMVAFKPAASRLGFLTSRLGLLTSR